LNEQYVREVTPQGVIKAASVLADFAGIGGMIGGQVIDLECEGKRIDEPTLKQLQEGKTAALIRAACQMGCFVGGGTEEQQDAADRFGYYLGLCFQVVDDILDVTATEAQLGKPVGSDETNEKNTYVSFLGLEGAKRLAKGYTDHAKEALAVFGESAEDVVALTDALLHRMN
jgi:geranylgeranyl diphosphate synthase type II